MAYLGEVLVLLGLARGVSGLVEEGRPRASGTEPGEGSSLSAAAREQAEGRGVERKGYDYLERPCPTGLRPSRFRKSGFGHANRTAMAAFSEEEA